MIEYVRHEIGIIRKFKKIFHCPAKKGKLSLRILHVLRDNNIHHAKFKNISRDREDFLKVQFPVP